MHTNGRSIGEHLRDWRRRRHLSQLDLACEAEISTRHLSFVETGRAAPSREMIMRLAEQLEVPLRERNVLLLAAGFAPAYQERSLDDPQLAHVRDAIAAVLTAHEPFPALAVDRHWTLLEANRGVASLLSGAAPALLRPPVNVLRLSLHPDGLAPRITNLREWRAHVLARLRHQASRSPDPVLLDLMRELSAYPVRDADLPGGEAAGIAVPLRIETEAGLLSFLSTTMVFGTPMDVMLSELAIETFLPADARTAKALRGLLDAGRRSG
jgi:transcriptional regulator with XRE-family HTH domain